MATITLPGFTFGSALGMGVFEGIGIAFTSAKSSSSGLSGALEALKSKIDLAAVVAKVETSQEQAKKAEERESTKKSSLSIAYEKLNTLISDTGSVDMKASSKIRERKDAFYDRYYYLKPECEKNKREKVKDALKKGWDGLCSIGNAIKNFVIDVVEWVKENWVAIVTAIGVLLVAILIVVLTPLSAVFVACIAGILGLALLVADVVVACCNDGKGIATLLAENGHPILAQMFTGFQWGCDLVQVILPIGAAVKVISKVGFKQFAKVSLVAMKQTCKETFEAVFKSGFKNGFKNAFKLTAKSLLFDWDDLKLYNKDMLNLAKEPLENMVTHFVRDGDRLIPISDKATKVFGEYGIESLKILDNGDIDWETIAIKIVDMDMGKIDIDSKSISSYLNNEMIDGFSGKSPEDQLSRYLRNNTYSQSYSGLQNSMGISDVKQIKAELQNLAKQQFSLDRLPVVTPHDHFSTKQMMFVPFDIHDLVNHNGAITVYKNSIKTIARSFESAIKNIPIGRILIDASVN